MMCYCDFRDAILSFCFSLEYRILHTIIKVLHVLMRSSKFDQHGLPGTH